jgi:hypothetical protein
MRQTGLFKRYVNKLDDNPGLIWFCASYNPFLQFLTSSDVFLMAVELPDVFGSGNGANITFIVLVLTIGNIIPRRL